MSKYEITVKQYNDKGEFVGSVTHKVVEDENGKYSFEKEAETVFDENAESDGFMSFIIDCDDVLIAQGENLS